MAKEVITIEAAGREVRLSSPSKVYFPEPGHTKRDLAEYYLAVADAACLHLRERPTTMKRFVDGRRRRVLLPEAGPEDRARLDRDGDGQVPQRAQRHRACRQRRRPSGLGGQPRRDRLQPVAGAPRRPRPSRTSCGSTSTRPRSRTSTRSARSRCVVRETLADHGLRGFPKTSGSRGIHVNVRIEPKWTFTEVRRAALALAREVERRTEAGDLEVVEGGAPRGVRRLQPERPRPHRRLAPGRCARCPTPASRPRSNGTRSPDVDPAELRLDTVPARLAERGDPSATIDDVHHSLDSLHELADRDEAEGLGDAPWPPHFRKQKDEPKRVQPSRAKKD